MEHKELLLQTIRRLDGAYAPTTIRAYRADFEQLIKYCDDLGEPALPITSATLTRYIDDLSASGRTSASIRRAVAGIATIHTINELPDPTKHPEVRLAMRRMHRLLGRYSSQVEGITKPILQKVVEATDTSIKGLRNKALLLVAYDTLCRRSELVTLQVGDLSVGENASNPRILLRRSKSDQEAKGRWLHISKGSWYAISAWLTAARISHGFSFRGITKDNQLTASLGASQIARIYKSIAFDAGLKPELVCHISGHSMRVGAAQDL
jgi:site-specific recombinase XerD